MRRHDKTTPSAESLHGSSPSRPSDILVGRDLDTTADGMTDDSMPGQHSSDSQDTARTLRSTPGKRSPDAVMKMMTGWGRTTTNQNMTQTRPDVRGRAAAQLSPSTSDHRVWNGDTEMAD